MSFGHCRHAKVHVSHCQIEDVWHLDSLEKPGGCGTGGLPINRMKRLPLPPVEGVLSGNEPYPVIGVPGVAVPGVDKLGVDILLPPHFEQRDFSVLFVDAELEIELRPARRG